ncbi:hypothetical protein FNV43_RR24248 [Rhamnella rubrinervis]|uniref:Uncharacterized protein n=1 Tax=Rhamnella rubrinervis TaxID=2594499 RepID=A0A8K0DMF3_9ROSA|nr:hypothetical protein FNV43_RR24248 [Rhamnella rubrinervis]
MASLKRLMSSNLLPKSLLALIRPVVASFRLDASRYLNANATGDCDGKDSDGKRGADDNRSSGRFFHTRSANVTTDGTSGSGDPFSDLSFFTGTKAPSGDIETEMEAAPRDIEAKMEAEVQVGSVWESRETSVPGLSKEDVEVSVEQKTVFFEFDFGDD